MIKLKTQEMSWWIWCRSLPEASNLGRNTSKKQNKYSTYTRNLCLAAWLNRCKVASSGSKCKVWARSQMVWTGSGLRPNQSVKKMNLSVLSDWHITYPQAQTFPTFPTTFGSANGCKKASVEDQLLPPNDPIGPTETWQRKKTKFKYVSFKSWNSTVVSFEL